MKLSLKTKQIFPPLEMDGKRDQSFPNLRSVAKSEAKKAVTWNAKCPIFLGNFTPKTSNYCLKNRALGFPGSFREGIYPSSPWISVLVRQEDGLVRDIAGEDLLAEGGIVMDTLKFNSKSPWKVAVCSKGKDRWTLDMFSFPWFPNVSSSLQTVFVVAPNCHPAPKPLKKKTSENLPPSPPKKNMRM